MKKTLALALIAAMTISMASMTAFAGVKYNSDDKTTLDKLEATVTMTGAEIAAAAPDKYFFDEKTEKLYASQLKNDGTYEAKDSTVVTAPKLTIDETGVDDAKATDLNTAMKIFTGWGIAAKDDGSADDEDVTFAQTTGKDEYKVTLKTHYKVATTEDEITENLKELDKTKKENEKKKENEDKLQKLDEKYGANTKDDNTNGFDSNTGKAVDVKTTPISKARTGSSDVGDFYYHAASVAGAPDDANKTWVFDVYKTAGTTLGANNTAQIEFDLGFGDDVDLSQFDWKVYHIKGWCKAEQVKNVEIVGNKLYAWTNDFSPFVVTRGDVKAASAGTKDASNPSTGDFSAVPVALLAAAALGATGFVAYKKRKAE